MNITSGTNGGWFHGNLERVLGDGRDISFWDDVGGKH